MSKRWHLVLAAALVLTTGLAAGSARGAWIRQVLFNDVTARSSTVSVKGIVVNGEPAIYYAGRFVSSGNLSVYETARSGGLNGTWNTNQIDTNPAGAGAVGVDATLAGGVPYVGVGYIGPTNGSIRVISKPGATWQTEYQQLDGGNHYGEQMSMGTVNGRPAAVFLGADPSTPSRRTRLLENTGPGTWAEAQVPNLPSQGMARVSVAGLNGQPAVLASYFNGNFGDQLAERNGGGTWTVQQADFLDDSGAKLIIDETGEPAFFGSSGSGVARYYFRRGGTWQFDTVATGTNIVGLDAAIIDSTPTVAYLDRNDSKLHFRQKIGGNWNDTILETGAATDYDPLISLMDLNGAPAITYILSAGTGAKPLIYQQLEVPEPTSAMILGLVGAMGLSVRRRRAS